MTPGPAGARCALHPLEIAVGTCRRCGNFMCEGCAGPAGAGAGAGTCPACQRLAPGGFNLGPEASLGEVWGVTWSTFGPNWLTLTLGALVFFVCTMGASVVSAIIGVVLGAVVRVTAGDSPGALVSGVEVVLNQGLSFVLGAAVQAVVLTGYYRLLIDVLDGRPADLARMFSQLHLVPRMFGLQLLMMVGISLPLLLVVGGVGYYALSSQHVTLDGADPAELLRALPRVGGLVGAAMLLVVPALLAILPVTLFSVPELLVGECGPLEAIGRAWRIGNGQRLRLFGYSLGSGLVVMAGAAACLVGMLPAFPLATMLLMALFLALRRGAGLPPPAS
jgi:hypothetical protein